MSTADNTQVAGTAAALREVADWLDAHPEVTPQRAFVPILGTSRMHLETLAAALGDRAQEHVSFGERVEIEGIFGERWTGVRVYGHVPIADLADEPLPKPKYRPILPIREEQP